MNKRKVLVISFSPLHCDPRVQRQLQFFTENNWDVTAAGFTDPAIAAVKWWPIDVISASFTKKLKYAVQLMSGSFLSYYYSLPRVKKLRDIWQASGKPKYDLIYANDIDSLPVAIDISSGSPVYFDAHEYAPSEFGGLKWKLFSLRYRDWQCRTYLPKVAGMSTVCDGIAEAYYDNYGRKPDVIYNTPAYHKLKPQPLKKGSVRLVHHGAAIPDRGLEVMIEMMSHLDDGYTLDFYLMSSPGVSEQYCNYLMKYADELGLLESKVRFCQPMPMSLIPRLINKYDIGLALIQPNNFNYRMCLPNKIFEFIQARLVIVTGPSPEMASLVERYHLGVISEDFTAKSMAKSISCLTEEQMTEYKSNSDMAAKVLSYDNQAEKVLKTVEGII